MLTITLALAVRAALNPDGSQVMVSVCTLGLMAAYLISSRAGLAWTAVGVVIASVNAARLTAAASPEFNVAWAVVIMTAAIGLWSWAHALGRSLVCTVGPQQH